MNTTTRRRFLQTGAVGAAGSLMMGAIPGLLWVPRASAVGWSRRALDFIKELAEVIVASEVIQDLINRTGEAIKEILEREAQSPSVQERREQTAEALRLLYVLRDDKAPRLQFQGILQRMADDPDAVQRVSERLKSLEAASKGSTHLQALSQYEVILAALEWKQMTDAASSFAGDVPIFPGIPDDIFASAAVSEDWPDVEPRRATDPLLCDFEVFAHLCEK